jgi:hypothetical protein
MKLSFILAVGFLFFTGCATTKHHRQIASVTPKQRTDFAEYTMVNIVSANRMPAFASEHVDLSTYPDLVIVGADYSDADSLGNKHVEMRFTLRGGGPNNTDLSATISGNSSSGVLNERFVAIVKDISQNGLRPVAVQVFSEIKTNVSALLSSNADREEKLQVYLLEFRERLLQIYSGLPSDTKLK